MKIVTTCPSEYVGVRRVFEDGASLGLWKFQPLETISLPLEADLVIWGGNHPTYHLFLGRVSQPQWLLWTSPLLQTELAGVEMEHLLYYLREPRISKIWFGETAAAGLFPNKGFYAPYPVHVESVRPSGPHEKNGIAFHVPFGNKNKNVYAQLGAVKIFQETHPDVLLQTGGMLPEQKRFADAIGLKYEDVGWKTGADYYDCLHSARMTVHVSLSESFGYGVMDSLLLDTPSLVSPAVSWVPRGLGLVCPNPSSPVDLANSIAGLYAQEPPPEVRPFALKVAQNRNDALKIQMQKWESLL